MPPKSKQFKLAVVILALLFVLDILLWAAIFQQQDNKAAIYFLSVGQGDAILIILPSNVKVLIDGGPERGQLLEQLSSILPVYDRYIDLVVMTHPEADHLSGFIPLIQHYKIGAFLSTGRRKDTANYAQLRQLILQKQIRFITLKSDDRLRYQDTEIVVLAPNDKELLSADLNDSSLVLQLKSPEFTALFTGDISSAVEDRLAEEYNIQSDILKVAHHGSRFSSGEKFLSVVLPAISTIQVGQNNYGHPATEALGRLKQFSDHVFTTQEQGMIKIESIDNALRIYQNN